MPDRWDDRSYLQRLGDSVSQLINVALLNGMPDESVSGRAWRNTAMRSPPKMRWWLVRVAAEALFYFRDRGEHCRLAYEEDIERMWRRASGLLDDSTSRLMTYGD
jgi:hypothetical protein